MDIKTVSKSTNFTVIIMIMVFLSLPVLILMINFNLKNASPSNFIAVQIEGEPKIKQVIVQEKPVHNAESIKSWVKISTNYFLNYDINNFKERLKEGDKYMTKRFFPSFVVNHAKRIRENAINGYVISTSVVIEDPVLTGKAVVNGVSYYKYYVKTSTIYKSETKTAYKNHEIIVTVKLENPEDNLRGIAIDELVIK
jgi:hypothetical protein